jgi:xanthine/uracil permease
MQFRFGLDERPPLWDTLLYGLQWFAVMVPAIIIIGKITGDFQFKDVAGQMAYLQKSTLIMSLSLAAQLVWGHRMPLIVGPSTVLLIGIIASAGYPADTIYTSILCGGILISFVSMTGLLGHLKAVFTSRIVAVVLLLVAFTLAPTVLSLVTSGPGNAAPLTRILFVIALVFAMFGLHRVLTGMWKSILIAGAMLVGSIFWLLIDPVSVKAQAKAGNLPISFPLNHLTIDMNIETGVMISFIFCFMALFINDIGSIESMNALLKPEDRGGRVKRGILISGLSNVASGLLGVIGPVNYSLSPGVITATGCASRITMFPAALLLLILSFSPDALGIISNIPAVVIGGILIYILSMQISAGLVMTFESPDGFTVTDGLIIGLPLLLSTIIAFLPAAVLETFPALLRPIIGNGFVVGVVAALIMEHGLYRVR